MSIQVAMIRGINVGGTKVVKMDRLRALFATLGFSNITTYLQSGNVLFAAEEPEAVLEKAIQEKMFVDLGLAVDVAVRSAKQLTTAVKKNPLATPGRDFRHLHATFLIAAARPSLKGLELPLRTGEEAVLVKDIVYLYCPHGYGETKIHTQYFERVLNLRATTRNWVTVTTLEGLANQPGLQP